MHQISEIKDISMQAMNYSLIGDLIVADDIVDDACYFIREKLIRGAYMLSPYYDSIIFFTMVNIAKDFSCSDDRFRELIVKKIMNVDENSLDFYNIVNRTYLSLVRSVARLSVEEDIVFFSELQKKYYASILANAIAPKESIFSLFEICWDVFCNDLGWDYVDNQDICGAIAYSLHEMFDEYGYDDSDLTIGSSVYSIQIGIRALAVYKNDVLEKYIHSIMSNLDKYFNQNSIVINDCYLNILFNEWVKNKENITPPQRKRKVYYYENLKLNYVLEGNKLTLRIPSFAIKSYNGIKPNINVYKNGILCLSKVINLENIGSGIITFTAEDNIELTDFIEDSGELLFSVDINVDDKLVYSSESTLFRNFILFHKGREIISNECAPGEYILISNANDVFIKCSKRENLSRYLTKIDADIGDYISTSNKTVFFFDNSSHKNKAWIIANLQNDMHFRTKYDNEYEIIDGDLLLGTSIDFDPKHYGVRINDTKFNLNSFSVKVEEKQKVYNLTEILDIAIPTTLILYDLQTNEIKLHKNVVKFNDINIEFDSKFYYGEKRSGQITFTTRRYHKEIEFNSSQSNVAIEFKSGQLIIEIPRVCWSLDGETFYNEYQEQWIWYKSFDDCSDLKVFANNKNRFKIIIGNHKYEDGESLSEIIKSFILQGKESIMATAVCDDFKIELFTIGLKQKFYRAPLFDAKYGQLLWDPRGCYVGDPISEVEISLADVDFNIVRLNRILPMKREHMRISPLKEGAYVLRLFTNKIKNPIIKIPLKNSKVCIGEFNYYVGIDKKHIFDNRIMNLQNVVLNDNRLIGIKRYFIKDIKFIKVDEMSYIYSGNIYIKDDLGESMKMDKLYDDSGNLDPINPVRIEVVNKNNCWIAFGYDVKEDSFCSTFMLDKYKLLSNMEESTNAISYYVYELQDINGDI